MIKPEDIAKLIEESGGMGRIVASAVRVEGRIFTGKRHRQAFDAARASGLPRLVVNAGEQGFVTEDGTFLDREEAAHHALAIGQVTREKIFNPNELYSEDLW